MHIGVAFVRMTTYTEALASVERAVEYAEEAKKAVTKFDHPDHVKKMIRDYLSFSA